MFWMRDTFRTAVKFGKLGDVREYGPGPEITIINYLVAEARESITNKKFFVCKCSFLSRDDVTFSEGKKG